MPIGKWQVGDQVRSFSGLLPRQQEAEWEKTKAAYREAGAPFGWGRGLDIWVEHGQLTTVN
jgi:hypothetical protein